MVKRLTLVAALALAAVPTAAAGPAQSANAHAIAKTCANLKAQMGARNFNAVFAPRTQNARAALRNCARREAAAQAEARVNAAQTCALWRRDAAAFHTANPTVPANTTFAQHFGTENANFRDAFGRCVSTVARAQNQARREAMVNAAQTCALWRRDAAAFHTANPTVPANTTFAQHFGTENASFRNAFGRCVATVARAQND